MSPDIETMLTAHDAALVIGDPALQIDRSRYFTLDLAEEWIRYTGSLSSSLSGRFVSRRCAKRPRRRTWPRYFNNRATTDLNLRVSTKSPANGGRDFGLKEADVRSYLTESIYYHLDAACLEGLQLFYRYAAEIGALPTAPKIIFLDVKACIA